MSSSVPVSRQLLRTFLPATQNGSIAVFVSAEAVEDAATVSAATVNIESSTAELVAGRKSRST